MKINKHIEIVRAHDVSFSSMSLKSGLMIQNLLSQYYEHVSLSTVGSFSDLQALVMKQPDLVFLGLKRIEVDGELIWLSEYLDEHGIAYTGSTKPAIELDLNKAEAKLLVQQSGIATPAFFTSVPGQHVEARNLPVSFPLFIKPLNTGGGKGIGDDSVARNFSEFERKVGSIFDTYGSDTLVEQYLDGREFSVAILDDVGQGEPLVMPIEIITEKNFRGDRVLGSRVKKEDNEQVIAVNDKDVRRKISTLAKRIYDVLGGRDLARIDIRMDAAGEAHFLEVNFVPAPGTRYFAGACRINQGLDYKTMILRIVELGLARNPRDRDVIFESVAVGSLLPALEPAFEPV